MQQKGVRLGSLVSQRFAEKPPPPQHQVVPPLLPSGKGAERDPCPHPEVDPGVGNCTPFGPCST